VISDLYGHTRSVVAARYALITPEGFVSAPLLGWPGAAGVGERPDEELLLFVREGAVDLQAGDLRAQLGPVRSGDVIWMAPYCPQWFVATGKTPARYIYYKDVNRDPLALG
jgi:hypothetical protein